MKRLLARIPWPVWVALIPAILIGLNELRKGGRLRVEVAGSGAVALLGTTSPPTGLRFGMEIDDSSFETSVERIREVLRLHPGIVVFGIDGSPIAQGTVSTTVAKERLATLVREARNSATVSVIVGYHTRVEPTAEGALALADVDRWWRRDLCRTHKRLRCVSLSETDGSEADLVARLHAEIVAGVRQLGRLRATTQVRR